ncbi:MAG: branched-chain amino acid ABC transporter permease [Deltaproteobacteria bacterium]|nr:branched-chain amino acid ABC transporter permease [Deltaproteobacteria bacterium]
MTMTSVFAQQIWNGLVTGMAYVLFSMGLNLIFGILGVINMAHGELYMLGAMLLWTTTTILHLNFFLGIFLSVVVVALIGIVFNRLAVKPIIGADPLSIMLSTMAMSVILMNSTMVLWNTDARPIETPFKGSRALCGAVLSDASLVLCGIGTAVLFGIHFFLTRTTIGKAMRATAQDRVGAHLIGIDVNWIYAFTMAVAAALAAIAGTIIGPIWVAYPAMGQDMLLKGFAIVVVSGLGNLRACVITGLLLGVTEALFSQYISMYYRDAYAFGIMVIVCLLRPQGLFTRA